MKNNRLAQLTTEDLLNIFWYLDSRGLIDPNICFDPEHFMDTVVKEKLPDFDYHRYLKTRK